MYETTNAITVQLFCKPFGDDHLHTVQRKDNGGSTFNICPPLKSMLLFLALECDLKRGIVSTINPNPAKNMNNNMIL